MNNSVNSNSTFYLLIAGSREFKDYTYMVMSLDKLISKRIEQGDQICIVSGGARGADKLAERYAIDHDFELRVFPADWDRFGKSAGYRRNRQMHEFIAQFPNRGCVCFWDGESRGTQHNFTLAKEFKTPLRIKRFKNKQQIFNEIMDMQPDEYPNEHNQEAWNKFEHAYQDFTGRSFWD